jgi:hypothetical protein
MSTTTVDVSQALTVDGWMSEAELRWLAERAQSHKAIVELGCHMGRSTSALAANTPGTVYALDDWNGLRDTIDESTGESWHNPEPEALYKMFLRNTRGYSNIVSIKCNHAAPGAVPQPDMVFIDGSHKYEDVKRDIHYWCGKIAPGGLLCGHDYDEAVWLDVCQAVRELLPQAKVVPGTTIWYWQTSNLQTMDIKDFARRTGLCIPGELKPKIHGEPKPKLALATSIPDWTYADLSKLPKNLAIAIGIVSSGRYVPMEWGLALGQLAIPPSTNRIYLAIKGVKRDMAREAIVEKAIELGARNILFLDDDNPPPVDTVYKLLQTIDSAGDDVAIAAGIYCTKSDPPAPLVFMEEGRGPYWRWKQGEIFECQAIATGCMMIRAEALAAIPKPWFQDVETPQQAKDLGLLDLDSSAIHFEMTDDIYFCRKVKAAGMKILAHGGVLPGHWDEHGNVYFLPDDSYPMRP